MFASDHGHTIRNCTFAHNVAYRNGGGIFLYSTHLETDNTIVSFSEWGSSIYCRYSSANPVCCDLYGNVGGDWVGEIAGQYGINGNICEDPLFCDPEQGNFRLMDTSPCAPFSPPNPECDLIGARTVGCGQDIAEHVALPHGLYLAPSRPNPFSQTAEINYRIPGDITASLVLLNVLDPAGRLVQTLVQAPQLGGNHSITWNGTDHAGKAVTPGVYFCRLKVGEKTVTRRVLLVR